MRAQLTLGHFQSNNVVALKVNQAKERSLSDVILDSPPHDNLEAVLSPIKRLTVFESICPLSDVE